jgi:hypothetical protein
LVDSRDLGALLGVSTSWFEISADKCYRVHLGIFVQKYNIRVKISHTNIKHDFGSVALYFICRFVSLFRLFQTQLQDPGFFTQLQDPGCFTLNYRIQAVSHSFQGLSHAQCWRPNSDCTYLDSTTEVDTDEERGGDILTTKHLRGPPLKQKMNVLSEHIKFI